MWLARIEPEKPGHDRRTFECPRVRVDRSRQAEDRGRATRTCSARMYDKRHIAVAIAVRRLSIICKWTLIYKEIVSWQ
jgi:hypothetical protein